MVVTAVPDSQPIQFIHIDDAGQCHLQMEAAAVLSKIQGQLAVVGIAGPYRTGKSFLLNRLLGRHAGFEVGPSVNPCTKGIWIWGEPVQLAPNYHCIFIDTEGLGSSMRTASCDMQIFSLCVLLSSSFIYNSMGAIDEQAIEDLHLVLNLAEHIHAKSGGDAETQAQVPVEFIPSFLWVIRDFHLKLVDETGTTITERDYLETSLQTVPGQDDKNHIRAMIRKVFPQRDCTILVRPTKKEIDLCQMEHLTCESLRPHFHSQVEALVNKVYEALKPKRMGSTAMSGPMLIAVALEYCNAINNCAVPTLQSVWTSAIQNQLGASLRDAVQNYQRLMNEKVLMNLPVGELQLEDIHRVAEAESLRLLQRPGLEEGNPKLAEYLTELGSKVKQLHDRAKAENMSASRRQCQSIAEELYGEHIEGRISRLGFYTNFEELTRDWDRLREAYLQTTAGPAQHWVLSTWLLKRMTESMQRVHNQLCRVADEHAGYLQHEYATALETERLRHDAALDLAQRQWLSEREELKRRLEASSKDFGARAKVASHETCCEPAEASLDAPSRRTRALPPGLQRGMAPPLVQGPPSSVGSHLTLETAASCGTLSPPTCVGWECTARQAPICHREGRPLAKQRARNKYEDTVPSQSVLAGHPHTSLAETPTAQDTLSVKLSNHNSSNLWSFEGRSCGRHQDVEGALSDASLLQRTPEVRPSNDLAETFTLQEAFPSGFITSRLSNSGSSSCWSSEGRGFDQHSEAGGNLQDWLPPRHVEAIATLPTMELELPDACDVSSPSVKNECAGPCIIQ